MVWSTRRPCHLPSTENMEMQMLDRLAAIGTHVRNYTVATLSQSFRRSHFGCQTEHPAKLARVVCSSQGVDMPERNNQYVRRSLRVEVTKCHGLMVLCHDLGGDPSLSDPAKDAVRLSH